MIPGVLDMTGSVLGGRVAEWTGLEGQYILEGADWEDLGSGSGSSTRRWPVAVAGVGAVANGGPLAGRVWRRAPASSFFAEGDVESHPPRKLVFDLQVPRNQ